MIISYYNYICNFTLSIGNIDYTSVNNGSITVDPSQPAPNITVNITDDTYFEDDETFLLTLLVVH